MGAHSSPRRIGQNDVRDHVSAPSNDQDAVNAVNVVGKVIKLRQIISVVNKVLNLMSAAVIVHKQITSSSAPRPCSRPVSNRPPPVHDKQRQNA